MTIFIMHFKIHQDADIDLIPQTLAYPLFRDCVLPAKIVDEYESYPIVREPSQLTTEFLLNEYDKDREYNDVGMSLISEQNKGVLLNWFVPLGEGIFRRDKDMKFEFSDQQLSGGQIGFRDLRQLAIDMQQQFQAKYINLFEEERYHFMGPTPYFTVQTINCRCTLGWMSYFGREIVDYVGHERFERLQTCHEKLELDGGYLIILQEEPMLYSNEAHRAREAQALAELGLHDFVKPQ